MERIAEDSSYSLQKGSQHKLTIPIRRGYVYKLFSQQKIIYLISRMTVKIKSDSNSLVCTTKSLCTVYQHIESSFIFQK